MNKLRHFLLYAVIVLTPFQDTILRVPLRQLGISFAIIPLLLVVSLDGAMWLSSSRRRLSVTWLMIGAYVLIFNAICLAVFGVDWNGVNLFAKAFNLSIMAALALYVAFGPSWLRLPHIGVAVNVAFGIAVLGVLFGDLNLLGLGPLVQNPLLHNTQNLDERWRGLTTEASTLSLNIGSLGLLSAAFSRSPAAKVFLIAVTTMLLLAGASKGAMLTVAMVGIAVAVLSKGSRMQVIAIAVLLVPMGYLGYQRFLSISDADALSQTTTAATRGTITLWAIDVVCRYPLGVGFSGFYSALSRYLPDAMDRLYSMSPVPLNYSEVLGYMNSAENASTKTLLFNFGTYFGFPYLVAFAIFVRRVIWACVQLRLPVLLAAILFVTVSTCTYNDPLTYYNVFVVYGIGWGCYKSITNPARHPGLPVPSGTRGSGRHLGTSLCAE